MRQNKTFALRYDVGKNVYFRCSNCNKKLKGNETHCSNCKLIIQNYDPKEKISKLMDDEKVSSPKKVDTQKELLTKIKGKKVEISFENDNTLEEEIPVKNASNSAKLILGLVTVSSVVGIAILIVILIYNFSPTLLGQTAEGYEYEGNSIYYNYNNSYNYALNSEENYEENSEENYEENYLENDYNNSYNNEMTYDRMYELQQYAAEFMSRFGDNISIYFENFETGFVFYHNPYEEYLASTIIFLPFAYYIWQKSSLGHNSILEYVQFQEIDRWSGTGVIQNIYPVGTYLTQRRLLQTLIVNSDNIASLMLRRHHGITTYATFINEIGANDALVNSIIDARIDAFNMGLFIRKIYEFLEAGYYYSNYFRNDILAYNYSFVNFSYPVANKTAWGTNAMHEVAIVYAPSPFSLSILSSRNGNNNDRAIFREIASFFERFNENF